MPTIHGTVVGCLSKKCRACLVKVALSTFVLLIAFNSSDAHEWRGLVPLRSIRADVMRLLNQCSDQREACRFTIESEDVHILFSGGLSNEHAQCVKDLPPETIMFIEVEPRADLKRADLELDDLHLDKKRLRYFNVSVPAHRDFKGYRSDDGLVVSLWKNRVLQVVYFASEADRPRCAGYYQRPESFVEIVLVHVPLIYRVTAPESIKDGEKLRVSAMSDINETRGYEWAVSAGKIIAGQYTKEITVDTTGLAGQRITVKVEIQDALSHAAAASCIVQILPK
jgi:hypothetical protein